MLHASVHPINQRAPSSSSSQTHEEGMGVKLLKGLRVFFLLLAQAQPLRLREALQEMHIMPNKINRPVTVSKLLCMS